jgi:hypothetical protein
MRGGLGKSTSRVGLRVVVVDAADAMYIYTENTVVLTIRPCIFLFKKFTIKRQQTGFVLGRS